jgi:hypothetical protein
MKSHFWEVGIALPLAKTVRSPVGGLDPSFSRALKECQASQLASSSTVSSLPISYGRGEDCEIARRRLGSEIFGGPQRVSSKPIGIVVNCVFAPISYGSGALSRPPNDSH